MATSSPAERAALCFLAWMLLLLLPWGGDPWARRWIVEDALLGGIVVGLMRSGWEWRLRPLFVLWVVLPEAYFEAGNFGTRWRPSAEAALIWADRHWFGVDWYARHTAAPSAWSAVLEGAYLSNYLLVFAWISGFIALTWVGRHHDHSDDDRRLLASVVGSLITALLACYAVFPLVPAVTPRLYFPQLRETDPAGFLRGLNHLLLARGSVPWGILPSGHVAGPVAMGCAFLHRRRWVWGGVYLGCAALIGVAIVRGDYHFVCDGVAGAVVGWLASIVVEAQVGRRSLEAAEEEQENCTATADHGVGASLAD